jgi:hypothetical protein
MPSPDPVLARFAQGLRDADAAFARVRVPSPVDERVLALSQSQQRGPRRRAPVLFATGAAVAAAVVLVLVLRPGDRPASVDVGVGEVTALVAPSPEPVVELASGAGHREILFVPRFSELAVLDTPGGTIEPLAAQLELDVDDDDALAVAAGEGVLRVGVNTRVLTLGDHVAIAAPAPVKPARIPSPPPPAFDLTREIRRVEDLVLQKRIGDAEARLGALLEHTTDARARTALSAERVSLRARSGGDVCAALREHRAITGSATLDDDLAALAHAHGC